MGEVLLVSPLWSGKLRYHRRFLWSERTPISECYHYSVQCMRLSGGERFRWQG